MLKNRKIICTAELFASICYAILFSTSIFGQTTVFSDDFSTNTSAAYTTSGAINGSSFSLTRSGADWGARRNTSPAQLELTNDASGTTNANGWVYAFTPTGSFTAPYNTVLSSNPGLVTWTFNMRQIRPNPAGFGSGSYGAAYVLGSTSTSVATAGDGYAVVIGNSGTPDPIRLVSFTGGLQGTLSDIITSNTVGVSDPTTNYISAGVTYNPATNQWQLLLRNDGSTAFADPATGMLVSQGSAVNTTFTGMPLTSAGGYWQGSTAAVQTAFFDNAKVTVVPDAAPAAFSINDVAVLEGNSGTMTASFTVTRSNAAGTSTVDFATADDTATVADNDYAGAMGTLTFNPGETTKMIDVLVNGDTMVEADQSFFVNLTNPTNAMIADAQGVGTINNDDTAPLPTVTLSVSSNTGSEIAMTVITVTATASSAVSGEQTVDLGVSGTNITASDYTLSNTTLTLPNGSTTGSVTFTIVNDTDIEGTEIATLTISNPSSGITIGSPSARDITITDDDLIPCTGVLINEVSANQPGADNHEYVEILAVPAGCTIPPKTYFVIFEGDGITVGTADRVFEISNLTVGANGLLFIRGTNGFPAPGTTTTITDNALNSNGIENGSQSYFILTGTPSINEGQDYDTDDNGTLEGLTAGTIILDSIAYKDGSSGTIYAPELVIPSGAPDAISRFAGNTANFAAPDAASSFYGGDLSGMTSDSTLYDPGNATANLPVNAAITPGTGNFAPTAGEVFVGGCVMDNRGFPISNVTVIISGGPLTQPRFVTTSGFGYFGFTNVSVGNTYVVSVMSDFYSFSKPSQVIIVNDEHPGLLFTGTRFFAPGAFRK